MRRFVHLLLGPGLAAVVVVAIVVGGVGCGKRSADPAAAPEPDVAIVAEVVPSVGDLHLALLPSPVQLLIQARPAVLLADPTLSIAVAAFLGTMSADAGAAAHCAERLARGSEVVTYAWTGGAADGWVVLLDARLDDDALAACLASFGVEPEGGIADPAVGRTLALDDGLLLARLAPDRRAFGLAVTVETVRAMAAGPPIAPPAGPPADPGDVLSRLRQGDLKLYVDLDQLAGLGATSLPLIDDADRVGLILRLETMRADAVALVRARGAAALSRLEQTLDGALLALRRIVLDEPGISAGAVYRIFEEARLERLAGMVRIELQMDRPTLGALVGILAHRVLPSLGEPRPRPPADDKAGADAEAPEADEPDGGATDDAETDAGTPDAPEPDVTAPDAR